MDKPLSFYIPMNGAGQTSKHMPTDPTPRDQAIYVPSLSPGFCKDVYSQNWSRPLPDGVDPADLDILNPNSKLLHLAYVMTSAGQALNQSQPCIVTARNRGSSVVLADSGGYPAKQVGSAPSDWRIILSPS